MLRALLSVCGLAVGALVVLTVWFTITAEPPKYNIDTKAGQAMMWLDADLEACTRVDNHFAKDGKTMTPEHFMYKHCNYIRDPNVDIIKKYVYTMVGR